MLSPFHELLVNDLQRQSGVKPSLSARWFAVGEPHFRAHRGTYLASVILSSLDMHRFFHDGVRACSQRLRVNGQLRLKSGSDNDDDSQRTLPVLYCRK